MEVGHGVRQVEIDLVVARHSGIEFAVERRNDSVSRHPISGVYVLLKDKLLLGVGLGNENHLHISWVDRCCEAYISQREDHGESFSGFRVLRREGFVEHQAVSKTALHFVHVSGLNPGVEDSCVVTAVEVSPVEALHLCDCVLSVGIGAFAAGLPAHEGIFGVLSPEGFFVRREVSAYIVGGSDEAVVVSAKTSLRRVLVCFGFGEWRGFVSSLAQVSHFVSGCTESQLSLGG